MLDRDKAALIVIDFQDKLLSKIQRHESIVPKTVNLVRFARELALPVIWTEQYKKGLGPTNETIAKELEGIPALEKMAFGCLGDSNFASTLDATGRRQLLITGIESHICVMQTVLPALERAFEVYVATDATGSCNDSDREAGLARMERAGAKLVTSQMAMFEILREAGTPEFKKVLPLLK
jgi:nicotinamidase-related amidase